MVNLSHMRRLAPIAGLAVGLVAAGSAQNAPAPQAVPAQPLFTDADNFFIEYQRAADLVHQRALSEAMLVMQALGQRLTTSPWLEIALLKHHELQEDRDPARALEGHQLVLSRLATAAYYQAGSTGLIRQALRGAAERGVRRVRLKRLDGALGKYFARFHKYPEALTILATHLLVEPDDLVGSNNRMFRYQPNPPTPARHNFMSYDLERVPREPFAVAAPRLQSTTKISDAPRQYAALIQTHPRKDPEPINEGQTLEGYFVAAVTARGAVVCTHDRVLILPVPR
jgi:hypothetical protein